MCFCVFVVYQSNLSGNKPCLSQLIDNLARLIHLRCLLVCLRIAIYLVPNCLLSVTSTLFGHSASLKVYLKNHLPCFPCYFKFKLSLFGYPPYFSKFNLPRFGYVPYVSFYLKINLPRLTCLLQLRSTSFIIKILLRGLQFCLCVVNLARCCP